MYNPFFKYGYVLGVFTVWLLLSGCATYYQRNADMLNLVYQGKFEAADELLEKPKLRKKKKDLLLYYLNRGTVSWMKGDPIQSNAFFQQADFYIEDTKKNIGDYALGFVANQMLEKYIGEGYEQILLHYYTTLNYLNLGQYDEALVECKRMQLKLQKFTDECSGKNVYRRDAFAHLLLGIVYDAMNDNNNAFIAYRNAFEIYESDYAKGLSTGPPEQLKRDIVRTAYRTGFYEEAKQYEQNFGIIEQTAPDTGTGQLLFFWNNGLCPIKDEWSVEFIIVPGAGNQVYFENSLLNMRFSFNANDEKQKKDLSGLKVIRVAFPRYITREPVYNVGILKSDSFPIQNTLEKAEPVNEIAFTSLQDRMFKEFSVALIRMALKQLAEMEVRKNNQGLGAAVGLFNAFTEQADTRNWQLLPYSIQYTRMTLPAGQHTLHFTMTGKDAKEDIPIKSNIKSGATSFGYYQDNKFSGFRF